MAPPVNLNRGPATHDVLHVPRLESAVTLAVAVVLVLLLLARTLHRGLEASEPWGEEPDPPVASG